MAYTILNTDGTILLTLADNHIDQSATNLVLIGKNYSGFGEYLNNNLVTLLANSANTSAKPPRNPLKGQTWYDTSARRLKVYDGGFKPLGGSTVSSYQPTDMITGDLWWDSVNQQLKVWNGSTAFIVGPQFSSIIGESGWVLPSSSIKDLSNNIQKTVLLKDYGDFVGMMSTSSYTLSLIDSVTYFNTSTARVESGLTIKGDISYTGKIMNRYLSMNVDISILTPTAIDVTDPEDISTQNTAIIFLLRAMFPINLINGCNEANGDFPETGVIVGSECRVLCQCSIPNVGYQIRRFISIVDNDTNVWVPYIAGGTNIICYVHD